MSRSKDALPMEDGMEAEVERNRDKIIITRASTRVHTRNFDLDEDEVPINAINNTKQSRTRKRSRRKRDNKMEEERIKRWKDNAEEWVRNLNTNSNIKIIKSAQKEKADAKLTKLDEEKKKWYGDVLKNSKLWPKQTNENIIRIYSQNVNGISKSSDYNEWEIILEHLQNFQVDIACLSEINLDLNKARVKYKLNEKARILDKTCSLVMTASKYSTSDNENKRGGILSMVRGHWSGREIEKGADKLGRWTFTTLSGKANRKVTIIAMYRVCDQRSHGDGGCTIFMQQETRTDVTSRKANHAR